MKRLTADDFFTGLLAALKVARPDREVYSLRSQRFDRALDRLFRRLLEELAPQYQLVVTFRIRLHPIHGDSITVRDAIYRAAQRNLVSLDNPEYQDIRLKLSVAEAEAKLMSIPGGTPLFEKLAQEFDEAYELATA